MATPLERLKELVLGSEITLEDKNRILDLFGSADEETVSAIVDLFSQDPTWIYEISENIKQKETALASDDNTLWDKLIEAETERLKEEEGKE